MMNDKHRISIPKLITITVRHSWKASPLTFTALMICSLTLCAIQTLEIYALRTFFDTVSAFSEGAAIFYDVIKTAVPIAVILLLGPVSEIGEYLAQGYFWRRGSGYLLSLFHLRAGKIPMEDFEISGTFDDMKKAWLGSEEAPAACRSIIQLLFYYVPFFVLTSIFLFTVKPLLVFAIVFIFVSVMASQLLRASTIYRFENENAGLKRQTEYFESCITAKEYFKETRTLGVFSYFFKAFLDAAAFFNKKAMHAERKIALTETLLRLLNILGYAGIVGLLLYYVYNGSVSVGAFATVFYSVDKINNVLKRMVEDAGEAIKNITTTSFLLRFLESHNDEGIIEKLNKTYDIHIKDVSFAYPGGATVLKNINLDIRHGETLAIVGENGAGKTTLTKLIIGLYRPSGGTILYGNKDISLYAPHQRYEAISGVFQNFIRYKMSAGDNIRISDMQSPSALDDVLTKAGVPLDKLPQGMDTMLSREYNGTELSGGEWQRVAIARGFYRAHDMIILDEPTAAIDPIEESNIFRLFKESSQGKTAVLVTHRLGSAKIADKIIVLDSGEIIESGNHAELMNKQGRYASMFSEQARWYQR